MPIFEYQCEKCEKTFQELVQNPLLANGVSCGLCGSKQVVRLFSSFASGSSSRSAGAKRKESPWSGGGGSCGSACSCHP